MAFNFNHRSFAPAVHHHRTHTRRGELERFNKPQRHTFHRQIDAFFENRFAGYLFDLNFAVIPAVKNRAGHQLNGDRIVVALALRDRKPERRRGILRMRFHGATQIIARAVNHHEQRGKKHHHPQERN